MNLPGASELFRPTGSAAQPQAAESVQLSPVDQPAPAEPARSGGRAKSEAPVRPSGRRRHEEKITVYISAAELVALEQARLSLRVEHGIACDRGRIVREAVATLLADFDERGSASTLVQRLASG